MFSPKAYENSGPDGIGVLEIVSASEPKGGQPRQFVPLKRTELRGEITGPLASLSLTQVYGYSREQCDKVLEAAYRFPLPGDAAVTAVRVRFGDVEIRSELKEREAAEADYERARREGRQAALVSRESPDVFTVHIAGIQPDQDITVQTDYVELARAEGRGWSLRVPLTVAPRYVRSDESGSRHIHGQPLYLVRDPGHRFTLDLELTGAGTANSGTHKLDVSGEDARTRIQLRDGEVIPDRDFVLVWQPRQEQDRPALDVWLHKDPSSGQVYFLAQVAPPATSDRRPGIPREVILLVDHSGSMGGAKWDAADWAVKRFLSGLTEDDTFNLGLFHDTTRWFSERPRRADSVTIKDAIRFLERHRDSGGTELGVALEQALDLERAKGDRARHVLIITDAEVSDSGRILRLADQEWRRMDPRRISVLCIDAAPNSFLALELAERGGGVARFLTSNPDEGDISTALDEVLADWEQPVLTGLRLEINRGEVQTAGRRVLKGSVPGFTGIDLGDLPAGRTAWVVGRIPRSGTSSGSPVVTADGDLAFRLAATGNVGLPACSLDVADQIVETPAVKALFGAWRILGLEYLIDSRYTRGDLENQLKRMGYDPVEVLAAQPAGTPPRLYAENARSDIHKALRELLVRESLDYGLASAETAFFAARDEAGKPVEGTFLIGNALPAGWSEDFLAYSPAAAPSVAQGFVTDLAATPAGTPMMSFVSVNEASRFNRCPAGAAQPKEGTSTLFSGVPLVEGGEAVLFDSSHTEDAGRLPEGRVNFSRLKISFPDGAPALSSVDPGPTLLVFIDDLSAPRARVRVADLVRQGGERPLNLSWFPGQRVRIVLADPSGAWASGARRIEVALGWGG